MTDHFQSELFSAITTARARLEEIDQVLLRLTVYVLYQGKDTIEEQSPMQVDAPPFVADDGIQEPMSPLPTDSNGP